MTAKSTAGHSAKHVTSRKHAGTSKHSPTASKPTAKKKSAKVTTKAKHPAHAKARGYAIGDWLPVCAAEAVAMSLRLAGQPVSGDEVAWLWELAGAREMTIAEALAAAARFGLDGRRPLALGYDGPGSLDGLVVDGHRADGLLDGECRVGAHGPFQAVEDGRPGRDDLVRDAVRAKALADLIANRSVAHALILGVDVPGPHCVLATPAGWWSWGQLWSPWNARIEEAWAVSWS